MVTSKHIEKIHYYADYKYSAAQIADRIGLRVSDVKRVIISRMEEEQRQRGDV